MKGKTMTPIETMARAIHAEASRHTNAGYPTKDPVPWDECSTAVQRATLKVARRAIEAFPVSDAMITAADAQELGNGPEVVTWIFNAMKAAALEEGP